MPVVEITTEEDELLRKVAPDYLDSKKDAKRRVRWALWELFRIRGVGGDGNGHGAKAQAGGDGG